MSIKFIYLIILIEAFLSAPKKKNLRKAADLSDDIAIIHLNDVHCGITDTIGYDGFALYRRELKQKYKHVIAVDVGDHIQGGSLGAISDGSAIIKIMNKIGFDVTLIGNHEFDYGIENLNGLAKNNTSGYICSNFCYRKNKTQIFEPYKIVKAGNKSIGFIGVLTPLTLTKTYLSTVRDSDGERTYDFLVSNGTEELYNTTQKYIDELKDDKKVDYVILLTHIGMDLEEYTSNDLLSKLTRVDAVFDGHTHMEYNTTTKDKENKDVHITQTGTKLQYIGQLIIKSDGSLLAETIDEVPEPDNLSDVKNVTRSDTQRWVDKNMSDFMEEVNGEYSDILNTVIGKSDYDLIIIPENQTSSRYIYCRVRECTVGNLIADAVVLSSESDFSIVNGGGVRNSIKKGNITQGDIINAFPWFNNVVVKELPGQVIIDALEFGVRNYPTASAGFPQVSSNLSYTFNPDINSTVVIDSSGSFVNITGERRITNVKLNGEPIDPKKTYSVALIEFLAKGGDGYEMFTKYETSKEGLATDTESITDYIRYQLNGTIPERYSKTQGRITASNETSTNTDKATDKATDTNSEDGNSTTPTYRHSDGLSTGAIVAIIIPCVVVLCLAAILALMLSKRAPAAAPHIQASESQNNFVAPVGKV